MPEISAIQAITYRTGGSSDVSALIAPPYDVLDERSKAALLARDEHNIVAIDLPHLPPKTVGPDEAYGRAGETYRRWLAEGVLAPRERPAVYVYQQTFTHEGETFRRRGLIACVGVQPFGRSPDGRGGIFPHEETFSEAKEDRLKLMRATRAQLSPIFGLYSDPHEQTHARLSGVIEARSARGADLRGTTPDGVLHEAWAVDEPAQWRALTGPLEGRDIFIADGHHRYNTTLNYRRELEAAHGPLPAGHPANRCLFVLVSMQDPGMIVLPTHRVLGGMSGFDYKRFVALLRRWFRVTPLPGDRLEDLEAALHDHGHLPGTGAHVIGLYNPSDAQRPLALAVAGEPDPLWEKNGEKSEAWRTLDVAVVQHLIVEEVCQPHFCAPGERVTWKFPHTLEEFRAAAHAPGHQLGLLLRPTPLQAVRKVSEAGELMPQKSTFFYPKLATGMVINPLE